MGKRGNDRPPKRKGDSRADAKPLPTSQVFTEEVLRDLEEIIEHEAAPPAPKPPPEPPAKLPDRPAHPPEPSKRAGERIASTESPPIRSTDRSAVRKQAAAIAARAMEVMKTLDSGKAAQLARQALELDRNCVDALVVLARVRATAPDELAEKLAAAVQRGERGLGRDYFERNCGKFWALLETRPYLRARQELANLLRDLGRYDEAIGHYEAILELDPGDPLRVRDALVGCHLALGYLEPAHDLLDDFAKDASATLAWAKILERYLSRHETEATAALAKARQSNSLVEDYLLGRKPMPRHTSTEYTKGQESEAQYVAMNLLPALVQYPQFSRWVGRAGEGK